MTVGVLTTRLGITATAVHAQAYTYNNSTGNFSTGFSPTLTAGSQTASLIFGGTSYTATDNLANAIYLNSLTFTNTGAVTIARGSVGSVANSLNFTTNGGPTPMVYLNNSGSLAMALDATLNALTTFTGSGSATLSGVLSGSGGLTKAGTGTLTLSGNASSFTGNVSITGGTLVVSGNNTSSGSPAASALGSLTTSGRTITVGNGTTAAKLQFAANDVFGNVNATPIVGLIVNAGATVTNNGLSFNVLGPITLNGGTLTGTGGVNSLFQMYSFRGTVTVGGGSASTISGLGTNSGYHLGSSTIFNVADATGSSATDLLVSAPLVDQAGGAGAGSLVKTGSGTMTLTGTNTYTGTTTISAGTLQIGTGAGLDGSLAGNIIDNASLVFGNVASQTYSGVISGTGSVTKISGGTLTLTGSNTFSGTTTLTGGTLLVSSAAALGSQGLDGLSLSSSTGGGLFGFTGGSNTISRNFTLSGTSGGFTTVGSSDTLTVSGILSGSGSLTIAGAGTVLLTGANTYTGTTTINTGTLQIGDGVGNGSLVGNILNNSIVTFASSADQTYDGVISGTGSLVKNGKGALNLPAGNTYTGSTTINGGTVNISHGTIGSSSGTVTISSNSTAELNFYASSSAGSTSIINNNTLGFGDSSSAGSASILNYGTFFNFRDSSSAGSSTITNNGVLYFFDSSRADGATVTNNSGASIEMSIRNDALSIGRLSGAGTVFLGRSSLTVGGAVTSSSTTDTISGVLQDGGIVGGSGGSLVKAGAGTLILTNSNTYTGGTTITGGTLSISSDDTVGTGGVTLNGGLLKWNGGSETFGRTFGLGSVGGSIDVTSSAANLTVASSLTGSGSLTKAGAGSLTLLGSSSYSGGTLISSGTVYVGDNNALGTGAVSIASGSALTVVGSSAITLSNAVTLADRAALSSGTVTTGSDHLAGLTLAAPVTLNSSNSATNLTVAGTSRIAITGVIGETSGTPSILIKSGSGTLELDNDNTYNGGTLVAQGKLVVNNAYNRTATGSGTGQGAVTVASGATLAGTFVIGGPVQLNSGATLAPGNSIGTSSVGLLTLAGGSHLAFEIGTDGYTSDRLNITSLLAKSGIGGVTFDLSGEHLADGSLNGISEGTFTLLTFGYESGFTAGDFYTAGLPDGWTSAFSLYQGGAAPGSLSVTLKNNVLTSSAAPEPGSLTLIALLGPPLSLARLARRTKV